MSEIKNGGLDQYGAKHIEQQQFGTAGVEGLIVYNLTDPNLDSLILTPWSWQPYFTTNPIYTKYSNRTTTKEMFIDDDISVKLVLVLWVCAVGKSDVDAGTLLRYSSWIGRRLQDLTSPFLLVRFLSSIYRCIRRLHSKELSQWLRDFTASSVARVRRPLIMYSLLSVCLSVCIVNFCKRYISKTNVWIFAQLMADTACILTWKWVPFKCRSHYITLKLFIVA